MPPTCSSNSVFAHRAFLICQSYLHVVEFNVVTRNAVIGSREECCIGEKLAEQP